jgi:BirA family biotin operon repressor/biotin-[acetyl-CoA-carboxylase] ligase
VLHHLAETPSTNDVAAELARRGTPARTVVVADVQTAGRGRAGRRFSSPPGGLYASLLVEAHEAMVPAGLVALVAQAAADTLDRVAGVTTRIKWPNDLWIGRRKVGGILLERGSPNGPVVAGVGINLKAVPEDLPETIRASTVALEEAAGTPVARQAVLTALLEQVDAWSARCEAPEGRAALAKAWRARMALVGERVTCQAAGRRLDGILEDASLAHGLLVREGDSAPVWRRAEHVQDLRPAPRRIS